MKCDYCNRQATRNYLRKNLCELHYLKANPQRNASLVKWNVINSLRSLSDDELLFLKHFDEFRGD